VQLKTVYTVPWPYKNVLSNRRNWPYDSLRGMRLGSSSGLSQI